MRADPHDVKMSLDTTVHIILRFVHIAARTLRTNIEIDDALMQQAMRSSGARTKRAAVEAGLRLLVETKAQAGIRRLRGRVRWQGDLDEMRRGRE